MVLTPTGLRLKAHSYQRLARTQITVEDKRRAAATALALAQLAEQIERGQFWTRSKLDRLERQLTAVPDDEGGSLIRSFFSEQRAKLFTEERAWWHAHRPRLDGFLHEALSLASADMGNVQIYDANAGVLTIAVSHGFDTPFLSYFASVRDDGNSACGDAMTHGARVIVPDVEASDIFAGKESGRVVGDAGVRAVQSTPLIGRAGQLIGMVSTHWRSVSALADAQQKALDVLIDRAVMTLDGACP